MSNTDDTKAETRLVMVDGRDASAYVILRPTGTDGTMALEAATNDGVDERQVAQVLRHIADQWAPRPGLGGVLDEIAVQRARQRTAFGTDEHLLPDGTGQYPETIAADMAQMAREQAAEMGYLDWLHVVRAAADQAFAENRLPELRTALVQLAAFTTGWIQSIDHRTGNQSGPSLADLTDPAPRQSPAPDHAGTTDGPEERQ